MLRNNLLTAWRNLVRQKSLSIINILGLSIGITCFLVIVIFIRYELSFDHYHSKADQVYKVVQVTKFSGETSYWNTTAYPLAEAIRNDFTELPLVTQAAGPITQMFRVEDQAGNVFRFEEKHVLFVDTSYPNVFDFQWIEGDPVTALSKPASIILTQSLAGKFFKQEIQQGRSILGKHMMLNNQHELTITGVVADAPANTSLKYNMLIPYEFFKLTNTYKAGNWSGNYRGTTFLVLNGSQSPESIEKRLTVWKKKYLKPEDDNRISYALQPLKRVHTDGKFGSSPGSYVMPEKIIYAALGVAIFILVIACVNFINLATAQAANHAREVGIKKILGCSKARIVSQFLTQNILLVCFTLIFSVALTQFALDHLNNLLSIIDIRLAFDRSSVGIVLLTGCVVILLACFYPSAVVASYQPVESLKARFTNQKAGGLSLRRSLIVFQFTVVQAFVIGTLVIGAQMAYFKNTDLGFRTADPIITNSLYSIDKTEVFRQKLLSHPAIKDVSFSSSSPMTEDNHHFGTSFRLPGTREEDGMSAEEKGVDMNYLSFYGLELLAGRNFSSTEQNFTEFIVNEKVVKSLGWTPEEAIGKRLVINEGEATIVGVIKDFHNNSLQNEISPCVLFNSNYWLERSNIKLERSANLAETLAFIEAVWKELYPDGIYHYAFLEDSMAENYALEQLAYNGFAIFSALTIIIGCLGLYGLLSFVTIRKTKEVGIRKVLGASVMQIFGLFSREFILLILVAFIVAAPSAYYFMDKWLQDFTYRIELSWWMFLSGVLLTAGIALLTVSYQSIKAAIANPVDSLRHE